MRHLEFRESIASNLISSGQPIRQQPLNTVGLPIETRLSTPLNDNLNDWKPFFVKASDYNESEARLNKRRMPMYLTKEQGHYFRPFNCPSDRLRCIIRGSDNKTNLCCTQCHAVVCPKHQFEWHAEHICSEYVPEQYL